MSELRVESLDLETAALGPVNPLPPLFGASDLHEVSEMGDADAEMRAGIAYGRVSSIAPYLLQDGYSRTRSATRHTAVVLENDVLRATVLPGLGGRLWSLAHKPSGRELLASPPTLQPANLALRNAWFAGGVEWNIGTIGHGPTTCEPLHAARLSRADGTPVLRLYEYERLRGVVFQVDLSLPAGSPVLLVHVRIANPGDREVPIYWWSNTAVPQRDDVRVLAPADRAFHFGYEAAVKQLPFPANGGVDRSYATRSPDAADWFFDLPRGQRPWIAALDGEGRGLVQTSTARLRGRKLFVWGTGPGGQRWQEWLGCGEEPYLEIQAGLARTQLEHLPLPAGARWSWVEAYGLLEADPAVVHGEDWPAATSAASAALDRLVPQGTLEAELAAAEGYADTAPDEVLQPGSGWGALERLRREADGDRSLQLGGTPFAEDTLTAGQAPWLGLLRSGTMGGDPAQAPTGYAVEPGWLPRLLEAGGWLASLHRGVLLAAAGDLALAKAAWEDSVSEAPSPVALALLAALAAKSGEVDEAVARYREALALGPELPWLAEGLVGVLVDSGRHAEALGLMASLPAGIAERGRIRALMARAALETGHVAECGRLLDEGIEIPDLREGERLLDGLWFDHAAAVHAAEEGRLPGNADRAWARRDLTLPTAYDFRMFAAADEAPAPGA